MPAQQLRAACFTLNNYDDAAQEQLRALAPQVKYLVFGREKGEQGTPHLQGYVSFGKRLAFSKVKDLLPQGAHIESAKGSPQQNRKYCTKEGDFEEFGDVPTPGKRTDIDALVEDINAGNRDPKRLRQDHPAVCARHSSFVRQLLIDTRPKPAAPEITLRPWQAEVIDIVKAPAPPRLIHFFVDHDGNAGKSTFATYLEAVFDHVQVMKPGRYADMAYDLDESVRILIMDCPRSREENMRYDFLEDVKDGRVTNSKYESYQKRLGPVHVLVFANFDPDETKLSRDRVWVRNI